jgi:hypothetical protein
MMDRVDSHQRLVVDSTSENITEPPRENKKQFIEPRQQDTA